MMQALRWILLGALLFGFLLFAVANWTPVDIVLPNGSTVGVPLPLLLLAAFLVGLLPAQLWYSVADVRLRRQQGRTQKLLEEALARPAVVTSAATVVPAPAAAPEPTTLPGAS